MVPPSSRDRARPPWPRPIPGPRPRPRQGLLSVAPPALGPGPPPGAPPHLPPGPALPRPRRRLVFAEPSADLLVNLSRCRRLIVVLSEAFLGRAWCSHSFRWVPRRVGWAPASSPP